MCPDTRVLIYCGVIVNWFLLGYLLNLVEPYVEYGLTRSFLNLLQAVLNFPMDVVRGFVALTTLQGWINISGFALGCFAACLILSIWWWISDYIYLITKPRRIKRRVAQKAKAEKLYAEKKRKIEEQRIEEYLKTKNSSK
jgi:hypothetical protein